MHQSNCFQCFHAERPYRPVDQALRGSLPRTNWKRNGSNAVFAQLYAEYHIKCLVCSVGWNHVKFQMLFRGLKQNALSKNQFSCNLFQVQLCNDWTITRTSLPCQKIPHRPHRCYSSFYGLCCRAVFLSTSIYFVREYTHPYGHILLLCIVLTLWHNIT